MEVTGTDTLEEFAFSLDLLLGLELVRGGEGWKRLGLWPPGGELGEERECLPVRAASDLIFIQSYMRYSHTHACALQDCTEPGWRRSTILGFPCRSLLLLSLQRPPRHGPPLVQ